MTYREMFEAELVKYNATWCKGGCGSNKGHKRGFVRGPRHGRIVHLDSEIATRSSLMRGLHEIGHVAQHDTRYEPRRWKREAQAVAFSIERMRALGVAVPRKAAQTDREYVARMRRFGDRVSAGLKARAKGGK
jgi:hypothetical protein